MTKQNSSKTFLTRYIEETLKLFITVLSTSKQVEQI